MNGSQWQLVYDSAQSRKAPERSALRRLISSSAGDWMGEERVYPSPWDPVGGTATTRVSNRIGLDGFVVIGD